MSNERKALIDCEGCRILSREPAYHVSNCSWWADRALSAEPSPDAAQDCAHVDAVNEILDDAFQELHAEIAEEAAQGGEQGEAAKPSILNYINESCAKAAVWSMDCYNIKVVTLSDISKIMATASAMNSSLSHPSQAGAEAVDDKWIIKVRPHFWAGRGKYHRADHCGYTDDFLEAGRFTEEEARSYAADCPDKLEACPVSQVAEGMVSVRRVLVQRFLQREESELVRNELRVALSRLASKA